MVKAEKTVAQLRAEIDRLQREEKALLAREVDGVVARIQEAIAYYQLTPDRLFQAAAVKRKLPTPNGRSVPAAPNSQLKGRKIAVKYRDPAGNTWTGRGSMPRWLRDAVEGGQKAEDFLVPS